MILKICPICGDEYTDNNDILGWCDACVKASKQYKRSRLDFEIEGDDDDDN